MSRVPRLFVVAAPSGAGKTSLVNALLKRVTSLRVSVSHTTRPMRPNETHGREYYFVDVTEFRALIGRGAFLEHAQVFDNFYGTSRTQLDDKLAAGFDVVLEIDWQGARQVREAIPGCVSIFILPPSRATLETRLRNRKTDNETVIQRRLRDAVADMGHCREFDYIVVNDDFDRAVADLEAIVAGGAPAQRLRSDRQELTPLLRDLV